MIRRLIITALGALTLTAAAPVWAQQSSTRTCELERLQPRMAVAQLIRVLRQSQELGPKLELTYALSNDHRGIVSRYDARRILQAGITAILESDDPQATYEANMKYFNAARATLGSDVRASKLIDRYTVAGQRAVYERDGMLNPSALPLEARKRFFTMLSWRLDALDNVPESKLEISAVNELASDHYEFKYAFSGTNVKGTAYAIRYDGGWVMTPVELGTSDLDVVTENLKSHYREYFISEWDDTDPDYDDRVRDALGSLGPDDVMWPGGYSDPYNYTNDYPVVFVTGDPDGSDHGIFTGYNPDTGEVDTYAFN